MLESGGKGMGGRRRNEEGQNRYGDDIESGAKEWIS